MPADLQRLRQAARKRKRTKDDSPAKAAKPTPRSGGIRIVERPVVREPSPGRGLQISIQEADVRSGPPSSLGGSLVRSAPPYPAGSRSSTSRPEICPSDRPGEPRGSGGSAPASGRRVRVRRGTCPASGGPEIPDSEGAGPSSAPTLRRGVVIEDINPDADSGLRSKEVARKLVGGLMLPADYEAGEKITTGNICQSLIQTAHYLAKVTGYKQRFCELERRASWAEEELERKKEELRLGQEHLRSASEEMEGRTRSLENDLATWKGRTEAAASDVKKLKERLRSVEGELRESPARAVEAYLSSDDFRKVKAEVVKSYLASDDYQEVKAEDAADAFIQGIDDCRARVQRAFPDADLSFLDAEEVEDGDADPPPESLPSADLPSADFPPSSPTPDPSADPFPADPGYVPE